MTPIQQILLGVGAKKKTYMDDVFSTFLYKGTSGSNTINNGVDLSGEGGLLWIKARDSARSNQLFDTARGVNTRMQSDGNGASVADSGMNQSFTSTGFGFNNSYTDLNNSSVKYSSWSFRKAPGFFDIVTYTGNGSARTIAHSLGCVPGCVMIKCTSTAKDWCVWHRGATDTGTPGNVLYLNLSDDAEDTGSIFNDTAPTASVFTVETGGKVNQNGETYVAYLFAGGESTASTATSVEFDGTNDKMTLSPTSGDLAFGTGDYTFECWVKFDAISSTWKTLFQSSTAADNHTFYLSIDSNSVNVGHQNAFIIQGAYTFNIGQWYHIAASRASGTLRMFVNGTEIGSTSDGTNWSASSGDAWIGANSYNGWADGHDGKISNMRLIKGTALYTSSFRPPTEPLKNVTNTTLLCLQGSSATSATVIPSGSITNDGATHSSDSPFDDPAGFKFGDSKEGIIKCGSYIGNGNADGPEINLGWEPQWIIYKCIDAEEHWLIRDSMRGIGAGTIMDPSLAPSTTSSESNGNRIELTATGFRLTSSHADSNNSGDKYVYVAIRRPDGYVGKPPELGTGVFAMDTGNSSSDGPAFDSNFAVDFALLQQPASSGLDWRSFARLTGTKSLATNTNASETTESSNTSDYNDGFADSYTNVWQSWMWKRHAGLDVVTYKGNGTAGHEIRHSLNKAAEMIWIKRRDTSGNDADWMVGHKGLNGGSSPWNEYLVLNKNQAEANDNNPFNNVAPTTTSFQLSTWDRVNDVAGTYIAFLFASVDGISKCGYYDGSENAQTITVGFQPRFILIKRTTSGAGGDDWVVADTLRGIGAGSNDKILYLNDNAAQSTQSLIDITSTGFTVVADYQEVNHEDHKYIYYCHA